MEDSEGRWSKAADGSAAAMRMAEKLIAEMKASRGSEAPLGYGTTAYELPAIFALTGESVKNVADAEAFLARMDGTEREAALYAAEVAAAARHALGRDPAGAGFIADSTLREMGLYLVDGTIPGIAVIHGKAADAASAASLTKELQQRGILILACGQFAGQLAEAGVKAAESRRLIALGDELSMAHAVDFAVRVGLAFGNIQRGEKGKMLGYIRERLKAFVLAVGEQDELQQAINAGAEFLGLPVITDGAGMVQAALDAKGITAQSVQIDVPVAYGPAFEGERIRKPDVHVEAGGGKSKSFELVVTRAGIEDGRVTLVGRDLDGFEEGQLIPLGILAEVSGKRMQKDFEPVLENKIELYCNRAEGLWFTGKRGLIWLRVSKDAFRRGLRLAHMGNIIHAMLHKDFPSLVDKVQVTLITDEAALEKELARARAIYEERDVRLRGLTDEAADAFYSCLLCQSFAPDHVCVITPERVGLCGSVSWLDAKAGHEITPSGPNQPIAKSGDDIKGSWPSVDDYVRKASHGHLDRFCLYSIMESPCTACGCFECIVGILPEANGFVIVDREFAEETPLGMKFSTLAGSISGGQQAPGFMGVAKRFMLSRKFLRAEGGIRRVVWMTSRMKGFLREKMDFAAFGLDAGFLDMIADETNARTTQEVLDHMTKNAHPALQMERLM